VASCTPADPNSGNSYTRTTCSVVARGQTPDTLADVAQYYWKTDLRDPALTPDRCTGGPVVTGEVTVHNNVCTNDALKGPRQNMITYTLGLGASGLMGYDKDYPTATSGDFYSIKLPENANPDAGICPWQPVGTTCNWPKPESNAQTNIDDLWHAAVNGRGTYFSASDPSSLAGGISSALQSVEVKAGCPGRGHGHQPEPGRRRSRKLDLRSVLHRRRLVGGSGQAHHRRHDRSDFGDPDVGGAGETRRQGIDRNACGAQDPHL
jgi:Tfp pilus tip-associated adhesin PilY1